MISNLDYALAYAQAGFLVLPCKGKAPAIRHGCSDATSDMNVVRNLWTNNPTANIGLCCDKLLVLDFDVNPDKGVDGLADLGRLECELGKLPAGPRSRTGGLHGGEHRFFRVPSVGISGKAKIGGTGIDIRIDNQYVIVAGSIHPETGWPYEWLHPLVGKNIRNGRWCAIKRPELPQPWIEWLASVAPKQQTSRRRVAVQRQPVLPPRQHLQRLVNAIQVRMPDQSVDLFSQEMPFEDLKDEAKDRWEEIVTALCPDPTAVLDTTDTVYKRCPICGEDQKFKLFAEFAESGRCRCFHCHSEHSLDGIGMVAWTLQLSSLTTTRQQLMAKNLIWYALDSGLVK